jgi:hypothetical protein
MFAYVAEPTTLKMSNTLTQNVPIMDGSNFLVWVQQMTSYLQSQGLFRTLQKSHPELGTEDSAPDMSEAIEKWEDANSKALGLMMLWLHFSIAYKHQEMSNAGTLLKNLGTEYGTPGVAGTFLEFKKMMDLRIPKNQDPSIALDQFIGHVSCLYEHDLELAPELQSLLLVKIPSTMSHLVQDYCRVGGLKELMPVEKMRREVLIAWEQKLSKGKQSQNQQHAQKISAVQHGPHQPGFQQQQQQPQQQQQGSGG